MFNRAEFLSYSKQYGPLQIDACAVVNGHNAHCTTFYSSADSFLSAKLAGSAVMLNPPSDYVMPYIKHYLACKALAPTTSGMFILPKWKSAKWWPLIQGFVLIHEYPAGSDLLLHRCRVRVSQEVTADAQERYISPPLGRERPREHFASTMDHPYGPDTSPPRSGAFGSSY
jgi:hypothetical protein